MSVLRPKIINVHVIFTVTDSATIIAEIYNFNFEWAYRFRTNLQIECLLRLI